MNNQFPLCTKRPYVVLDKDSLDKARLQLIYALEYDDTHEASVSAKVMGQCIRMALSYLKLKLSDG